MKYALSFLQSFIAVLMWLLVFSAEAGEKKVVILSERIAPEKKKLTDFELKDILHNLQFNKTEPTLFDHIRDKAKTHYIPMDVILRLKKISFFNPEDLPLKEIMRESGYDIGELPDKEVAPLASRVMSPNESPYRELFRGQAIRTLGVIGQHQKLPMYVINPLRNMMFEMKNPIKDILSMQAR